MGIERTAKMGTTLVALALASGCAQQRSAEPRDPPASDSIPSHDTDAKADSASGGDPDEDTDAEYDPEQLVDVGSAETGAEVEMGCRAVDFLFVVDNSGSMSDDQRNLIENFPAFVDGITSTLDQVDSIHVGVVTSDDYVANGSGCNSIGGLVTRTGGEDSSNRSCGPFASGANYMTEEDDLDSAFACAALVGTEGSYQERPVEAMLRVVDGSMAGPGQCNEGFLRDNALLVVVLLTDEADGPGDPEFVDHAYPVSPGTPAEWYNAVVQAKGGHPENAVMVSLVHYFGGACPPPNTFTDPAFFDGQNMVDLAHRFGENGFVRGICSDYGPVFHEAAGIVANACDNFVPAG